MGSGGSTSSLAGGTAGQSQSEATGGHAPDSSAGGEAGGGEGGAPPHVFSIRFDYRFDTAGFFSDPVRRECLAAAAAAWSALLGDDFPSIPAGTRIRLKNPENRDEDVWIDGIEREIDDVLIFVGTIPGMGAFGRGGPSGTADSSDPKLLQALQQRRDGTPFRPWAGSISFNRSADYSFDPTSALAVPAERFDFVSLATHELGHVLGFAASEAFTAQIDGASFVGEAAMASYGGPVPLTDDLGHLTDGTESEGVEALMTPRLANGERQRPTALDRAVLIDLGYSR